MTSAVHFVKDLVTRYERDFLPTAGNGSFKCYVTLFSGNLTPTHPLVTLITLNLTHEWPLTEEYRCNLMPL